MGWIFKRATARLMDRRQTTKDEEIYNRHWFPEPKSEQQSPNPLSPCPEYACEGISYVCWLICFDEFI